MLAPCYGLAESTLLVTGRRPGEPLAFHDLDSAALAWNDLELQPRPLADCGRPLPGQEVVVVDESLVSLPEGRVGEILVRGPSVAAGYFDNAIATRDTFGIHLADGRGPYLRTGDLGLLQGGSLAVVGRLKEIIKIRGRNLHAQDIEEAASSAHPAVRPDGIAAFGIDQSEREELIVVAEIRRTARKEADGEVALALAAAVRRVHGVTPAAVALIGPLALPRTSSGKIRRREARRHWLAGTFQTLVVERAAS